jgi:hypothetical protein
MNFYIFNPSLGVLDNSGKFQKSIVKGSSSFCSYAWDNARMARLYLETCERQNLDSVITEEMLDTMMAEQSEIALKKVLEELNKKPIDF